MRMKVSVWAAQNSKQMPSVSRQATPVSHRLNRSPQQQAQVRQRNTNIFVLSVALTLSLCAFGIYRVLDPFASSPWSGETAGTAILGHAHLPSYRLDASSGSRSLRKPGGLQAPQQGSKVFSTRIGKKKTRTVGVAVTMTGCDGFPPDGAAILQYSVMKQQKLQKASRYQYHFYVIYHPEARDCAKHLATLNYTLIERESPVLPHDIREGSELREKITKSGCCGEKELLKFEAFKMVQHDAVILIDMDAMVLKSLDETVDLLLDRKVPPDAAAHLTHPDQPIPDDMWILYTPDYDVVWPETKLKPAQGGFVVLKPNVTIYNEIMDIVRDGQWSRKLGWGAQGANVGRFHGDETFQGLVPYYFFILHKGLHSIALHWCRYNFMNVAPKVIVDRGGNVSRERCHDNQDECEDCRDRNLEQISSFHFTACHKPWDCMNQYVPSGHDVKKMRLCYETQRTWFELRSEMEASWGRRGRGSSRNETFVKEFLGYCRNYGGAWYEHIHVPYGPISSSVAIEVA